MNEKDFQAAISALMEYAYANESRITKADVHSYLDEILTEEAQYDHVYRFLTEKNILVQDTDQQDGAAGNLSAATDAQADKTLSMYLSDLKKIKRMKEEELQTLTQKFLENPKEHLQALMEQKLSLVTSMISYYSHPALRAGDLIQEGNLGLLEGLYAFDGSVDLDRHLKHYISDALDRFVKQELDAHQTSQHLLDRINALEKATRELAETLEREATLSEIAEYMHLSEEEVSTIMKHSIDALNASVEDVDASLEESFQLPNDKKKN